MSKKVCQVTNVSQNKRNWKAWNYDDKLLIKNCFKTHIIKATLPGKLQCVEFLLNNKGIKRKWSNTKDLIRNEISKRSRAVNLSGSEDCLV